MQKIFGQLGFVEQTGHGVPLIVDIYGKESFEIMDNFINVTIPFQIIEKASNQSLSETDTYIVTLLKGDPHITLAELTKLLHIKKSAIGKRISVLKDKGVIERVGSNKSGSWKVLK